MKENETKKEKDDKRPKSAAKVVRNRVERGGQRYWKHSDFPGLSTSAVATALSRLEREGVLQRVVKGVYFRPTQTKFGASLPSPSIAAAKSLNAVVHPAGLNAANVLGLTTQVPAINTYATPAPAAPRALGGSLVHTRRPKSRAGLSTEEGAILETLRDRARFSDLSPEKTAGRLLQLLSEEGRFVRLAKAALDEPPRVRAMLGALGEELGAPPKVLEGLKKSLNPLSRYDFGLLGSLQHAKEWQAK